MTDDVKLIHYKDIHEYGVYQPVVSGSGINIVAQSELNKYKLVVVTPGAVYKNGIKVPDDGEESGKLTKFFACEGRSWVLCQPPGEDTSGVVYTQLFYRKLEHVELFVGFRLKE